MSDHLRWYKLVLLGIPLQGTNQATHNHSHQILYPLQGLELSGLIAVSQGRRDTNEQLLNHTRPPLQG